ncbi:hypothetical protein [Streptomyces anulatus]|uniref:hypothetical protein n=1 Tax=Streptomyces anulatus TaxID=1892 RepID=UPI002F9113FD
MPAEQGAVGDLHHAGVELQHGIRPKMEWVGMPKLAAARNVVHNDSRDAGLASWHDEAPVVGFGFWGET